jgi:hypothetical protein
MNTRILVANLASAGLVFTLVACPSGGGGTQVQSGYHIEAKGVLKGNIICDNLAFGDITDGYRFDLEPNGENKWKALNIENDDAVITNIEKYMGLNKVTLKGPLNYFQVKDGSAERATNNSSSIKWTVQGSTTFSGCTVEVVNGQVFSAASKSFDGGASFPFDMNKVEQEPQIYVVALPILPNVEWTYTISKR